MSRASVSLGVRSVAMGGHGIPIDHPLAGVGHRLGKVGQTLAEVGPDRSYSPRHVIHSFVCLLTFIEPQDASHGEH